MNRANDDKLSDTFKKKLIEELFDLESCKNLMEDLKFILNDYTKVNCFICLIYMLYESHSYWQREVELFILIVILFFISIFDECIETNSCARSIEKQATVDLTQQLNFLRTWKNFAVSINVISNKYRI